MANDTDSANRHPELLAAELRRALDLLGQITGTISPDEVLGRIFSQFCIGKYPSLPSLTRLLYNEPFVVLRAFVSP